MTAGQDEARAQSVVYGWMGEHDTPLNVTSCMALIDAVRTALTEARDQGARDGAHWVDGESPRDGKEYICRATSFLGPVMLKWSATAKYGDGWYDWDLGKPHTTVTAHLILPPENARPPALAPLREAVVNEDAYPDLTDEQMAKLLSILPQQRRRKIISSIGRHLPQPTDAQAKAAVAELRRKVEAGEAFADNGDDLEREMQIENLRSTVVTLALKAATLRGQSKAEHRRACIARDKACAALSRAQPPTAEDLT